MKKLFLSNIKAEATLPAENDTTDIVLFPLGTHTINAGDEDGNPVTCTVKVDESVFNTIKAQLSNVKEYFSDFVHCGGLSGWLQDIKYDATKGILATVKWTQEGMEKIKDNTFKYISPSFYIDAESNIVGLNNPAFALVSDPAFTDLKNYPVYAKKYNKEEVKTEDKVSKVKELIHTEIKQVTSEAVKDQSEMMNKKMETMMGEMMDNMKKMMGDMVNEIKAMVKEVNAQNTALKDEIKKTNDNLIEVNATQCKTMDKLNVITADNKTKVLTPIITAEVANANNKVISASITDKINKQNLLVSQIQAEKHCDYAKAHTIAKAKYPEEFKI